MGTYFYKKKKNYFFVHLKSTFQKTLGAASLLSTHCPGTGLGGRGVAAFFLVSKEGEITHLE